MKNETISYLLKAVQLHDAILTLHEARHKALMDVVARLYDRQGFCYEDFLADYDHCCTVRFLAIPEGEIDQMPDEIANLLRNHPVRNKNHGKP